MRLLLLAAALVLAVPTAAGAQLPEPPSVPSDEDVAQARDHFVHGMELAEAERWDAALEEFTRSYALSGSPAALFNMGATLRSLSRFVEARAAFDRLLEDSELDRPTRRTAESMRDEVAAQIASVHVEGVPEGEATVVADGRELPPTELRPIRVELDPGLREIAITLPAHLPWSWRGELAAGDELWVDAHLSPEPSGESEVVIGVLAGVGAVVLGTIVGLVIADAEAQLRPRTPLVITLP